MEDLADTVISKTRKYLPTIGRFLILFTFFEDGWRLLRDPWAHINDFSKNWYFPMFLAIIAYLYNLAVLFGASFMILIRKRVSPRISQIVNSCVMLLSVVILQIVLYRQYLNISLLFRTIGLLGSVSLLLSETMKENTWTANNLPEIEKGIDTRSVVLLIARFYLVLAFVAYTNKHILTFWKVAQTVAELVLLLCIVAGYKTKVTSLVLSLWLFVVNILVNDWWRHDREDLRDENKYYFFQTISQIGGLIMVVYYGPGDVSIDDLKKSW